MPRRRKRRKRRRRKRRKRPSSDGWGSAARTWRSLGRRVRALQYIVALGLGKLG
jgi:hypothetical protein